MNEALVDSRGEIHFKIHPTQCPRLTRDFKSQKEDEEGLPDKETDTDLGHSGDAAGYMCFAQRPMFAKLTAPQSGVYLMGQN